MLLLLLSLITLFAGPLLFQWVSRSRPLAKTLDRLIVGVLVVLVVVLLVPGVLQPLGWWSLVYLAAGYLFPSLLERAIHSAAEKLHMMSLFVALIGLLLHAMLDGAGLAGSEINDASNLALAIVLHRFSMGLMLWLIVQPVFGNRIAWGTLVAMAAATVVGYGFSTWLLPLAGETAVSIVQALIVGTIIHSVIHRGHVSQRA